MKTYHDIVGDGGSNVIAQVQAQQRATSEALSGVRHRLAVDSGKGGVGKSTVTMALARALRRQGLAGAASELPIPRLGRVPFDPALAALGDASDDASAGGPVSEHQSHQAIDRAARRILEVLETNP